MGMELVKGWMRFTYVIIFTLLFSMGTMTASADDPVDIEAESAILVDAGTGKILFEEEADMPLPPASMSKMMTEYLVMEAIEQGEIDWDTEVEASDYAHYLGSLDGTSRVWLAAGEKRTVEELYTAMAVYSANDATVALAEEVAGSEEAFVELMNEKAAQFGMEDTQFVNANGLPNRMLGSYMSAGDEDDENEMSARDTAVLARELVNHYPQVLDFSSIAFKESGYFEVDLINFNWMLADHPEGQASPHTYPGVDGLKTGFTEKAGYSFAATAENEAGDMRLISVVMRTDSMGARFEETAKLLDYGFDHFVHHEVAAEGSVIDDVQTLPVDGGREEEVAVTLGDSLATVIHEDEADLYELEWVIAEDVSTADGKLLAPLEEGAVVGHIQLHYTGDLSDDYIQGTREAEIVDLVAAETVEKAGWFRLTLRAIGNFFSGIWESIVDGVVSWFS